MFGATRSLQKFFARRITKILKRIRARVFPSFSEIFVKETLKKVKELIRSKKD